MTNENIIKPIKTPVRCVVCNGFGTLKYGTLQCHGCNGKGYILVDAIPTEREIENVRQEQ